ncbi:ATP synthase subunit a [Anatilimnocola aggregata]|uniref:ATP synthase subunit a n=1 Tax=Anatilimnocola aggregata TaxID=2528021 RepID=A0A517YEN6_9BACT|nr:F0F1 ATP synthase subunit A [Anatilimnocola aggregata]QDU28710.1 ATP synthase subunit a [Anatilimnocola aggregata]
MADPILHIKDAYFFEVPKVLWPRTFKSAADVAELSPVWVELDGQFQDFEFHKQYHELTHNLGVVLPPEETAHHDWHEWAHGDAAHHGKPFDEFLKAKYDAKVAEFNTWKAKQVALAKRQPASTRSEAVRDANKYTFEQFLKSGDNVPGDYHAYMLKYGTDPAFPAAWEKAKAAIATQGVKDFVKSEEKEFQWSPEKLAGYSNNLSGKILIPQPFGRLRNLHERESGVTISKYMLIELAVGLILAILFSWLARRVIKGGAPKGRIWNLLETFVVFIRKEIAEPAIGGGHHDEHHDEGHAHGDHAEVKHGHKVDAAGNAVALSHDDHAHGAYPHAGPGHSTKPGHHEHHVSPATRFTPLLCTIFFFVLGCNLAGMLPWVGAPTSAWGVTFALALITFATVVIAGMGEFGFIGFFANQVPTMDMPWYMAIVMKPAIFLIEILGLVIKHAVLSVRLLANMVAGHLVLLAIMGVAFGAQAAMTFTAPDGTVGVMWWVAASAAVVGCALLSMLELFVAFLQAYVFTLLSALFIGAAIHKH